MMKTIVFLVLALLSINIYAQQGIESQLENTYRGLIRSIHKKDVNAILQLVDKDGISEEDAVISKKELRKFLEDPDSDLSKSIFGIPGKFEENLCKRSGKYPISPYAFAKYYGDKYKVEISRYENSNYYQVLGVGDKGVGPIKGCQYVLYSVPFQHEKDGKFYLAGMFGP